MTNIFLHRASCLISVPAPSGFRVTASRCPVTSPLHRLLLPSAPPASGRQAVRGCSLRPERANGAAVTMAALSFMELLLYWWPFRDQSSLGTSGLLAGHTAFSNFPHPLLRLDQTWLSTLWKPWGDGKYHSPEATTIAGNSDPLGLLLWPCFTKPFDFQD